MDGFPFVHRERVRLRDVDAFQHVNNAVYLTFLEEARAAYLAHLGLATTIDETTLILARVEIDYRSSATAGDEIAIGVRPARLGHKSFGLDFELRTEGRLVAEASAVLVGFDYGRGETIAIPNDWRRSLAA